MIYLELLYNFGVLIALSVLSGFVGMRGRSGRAAALLQGLLFGCAAVIGMLRPLVLEPGLIFDGRSVMISLAGLFFGPLAALTAAAMAAVVRVAQGGIGATMGVLVISSAALLGMLFHARRRPVAAPVSVRLLLQLGFAVHAVMLLLMFTIPGGKSISVLDRVGPPVITIYPLVTLIIGWVLARQEAGRAQERQLLQLGEELQAYFDTALDLFCIADADGKFRRLNPQWETVLGYPLAELQGRNFMALAHPDDAAATGMALVRLAGQEVAGSLVNRNRCRDGSYHWLEWRLISRGRLIYAAARDITPHKQLEQELRNSRQLFADIIEFLPDATLAVNRAGEVIAWNQAIEAMTGVGKDAVMGRGGYAYALPFYGERRPLLIDLVLHDNPDDRARYPYIRRDGSKLYSEIFIPRLRAGRGAQLWFTASPLLDANGEVVGAIETIRDITEMKQAQEAQRESEERYRATFENSGNALMLIDEDTRIALCNEQLAKLTGYRREELEGGMSWTDLVADGEQREQMMRYHHQRRHGGEAPASYEYILQDRDGRPHTVLSAVSMLPNSRQSLASLVDVTEQRRAQAALAASENLYRTVFENTGTATVILRADTVIELTNERHAQMTGYSKAELEGRHSWTEFVVPEDLARMQAYHQARRLPGPEAERVPQVYEYRFRSRTGKIHDCICFVMMIPGTTRSVASMLDISERKAAEQALREREKLYRSLIETTDTGFVVLQEGDGRVIDANARYVALTGRARDAVIGHSVVEWTAPHDRERNAAEVQKCLATGRVNNLEVDYCHPDGTVVPIEVNASVIITAQGRVIQTLCRDISERRRADDALHGMNAALRRMNEELRELDGQKNSIMANVSHELRTPLVAVRGYAEIMLEDGAGRLTDQQRQFLQIMLRNIDRLTALFDNLLEFSRDQQGRSKLTYHRFPLAGLLQDVGDTMQPRAARQGLRLIVAAGAPGLQLEADQQKLRQVLLNLAENAMKFTPAGGTVTLGAAAADGMAVVTVTDTGIGISTEDQRRIFDRFYQVDAALTRQYSGAGLGLSIVREIVHRHGGTIRVTSALGHGAQFTVTLPLRRPPESMVG